jgi:hypothetical protein
MCARSHRESLAINELPDIKANSDRELRRRTRQLWSRNAGFAPHGDNRAARVQNLLGKMYQHARGKAALRALEYFSLLLRRVPEILDLRVERPLEGRPCGAALDISGKAPVARDDIGVLEDSEHYRHHQIAR